MPPKRKTHQPRSYGRQAAGKTIKSLSLAADVAAWAEQCAEAAEISVSEWIEKRLIEERDRVEAAGAGGARNVDQTRKRMRLRISETWRFFSMTAPPSREPLLFVFPSMTCT